MVCFKLFIANIYLCNIKSKIIMRNFIVNLSAAAKMLGVSRPQIKNLVNGVYKTRKGLSEEQKQIIAKAVIAELKELNIDIFNYEPTVK